MTHIQSHNYNITRVYLQVLLFALDGNEVVRLPPTYVRIKQLNTIITDAPLSIASLAANVNINKDSISSRTYYILYPLACNAFFYRVHNLYRAVTRARACVVRHSNVLECVSTMTRMSCSMHTCLLDGRCHGRRCRVSLEQLGALCGGCVCQRWDYYIYIYIMY